MPVMKFGGTSLRDAESIQRVCSIIESRRNDRTLVVVSALGDTTDLLAEAAKSPEIRAFKLLEQLRARTHALIRQVIPLGAVADAVKILNARFEEARDDLRAVVSSEGDWSRAAALDRLLGCGERISSQVVAGALRGRGLRPVHLDARQLVVTEARHGGANAVFDATRKRFQELAVPQLEEGRLLLTEGFIASSEHGAWTTLGRGGSDYTATLAGASINADEVQIWTDVDGVMTADPSLVGAARSLPALSLREASELAYFGGRVLHPSTMLPAVQHGVPIRVLNSRRPAGEGTLIMPECPAAENVVKSVVYKENITLIDIHSTRMLMAHGFLAKIFEVFSRHETAVDMVSTSEVSVSITVDRVDKLSLILAELAEFAEVETASGKAIVCVVGEGIRFTLGIAAKVFDALDGIRIRMISLGASRVNVGFVVDGDDLETAVRRIHAAFFERP